MATKIKVMAKYRITDGKLKGFIGMCYAASFSEHPHGPHLLLKVDDVTSIFVHPKHVEEVKEPDSLDVRQVLLTDS